MTTCKIDVTLPSIPGYEILDQLGRGGMATVYRARHISLDRTVALKLLSRDCFDDGELKERFARESRAVAQLQHPNIAQLFEVGVHDGQPFLALEYVAGGTLAERLREPLKQREAAELLTTLARCVGYSHEQGIVHRDLKPANILMDENGQPKVADFGLAKFVNTNAELTRTGVVMGTPSYMAPEQASGAVKNIGPACDVYALGNILYHLLIGRPPFLTDDSTETLLLVLTEDPVPPRKLQPRIARDLETICLKCLEKTSNRRYGSGRELADDLDRFLQGRTIRARRATMMERAYRWGRRRPAAASLIGVSCLLAGTLLLGGARHNQQLRLANDELRQERDRSQRLFLSGKELANWTLYEHTSSVRKLNGSTEVQLQLANRLRTYLRELEREANDDQVLANEVAVSLERLAEIQGDPSRQNMGRTEEALSHYDSALAIRTVALRKSPDDPTAILNQVACLSSAGLIKAQTGQVQEARTQYQEALVLLDLPMVVAAQPDYRSLLRSAVLMRLGDLERELGEWDEAEFNYQQSLMEAEAVSEDFEHSEIASLAVIHSRLLDLAVREYRQDGEPDTLKRATFYGDELMRSIGGSDARNELDATSSRELVQALSLYADLLHEVGGPNRSLELRQRLVEVTCGMATIDQGNVTLQRDAGVQLTNLGIALQDAGRETEAIEYFARALKISDSLASADGSNVEVQRDLWNDYCEVGTSYLVIYRLEEAQPYLAKSLELADALDANNAPDLVRKAQAHERWGILVYELAKLEDDPASTRAHLEDARSSFVQAIEYLDEAIEKTWSNRLWRDAVHEIRQRLAEVEAHLSVN